MKKIGLVIALILLAVSTCQASGRSIPVRNVIDRQLTQAEITEIAEYLVYWECKAPKEDFRGMDQGIALLLITKRIHGPTDLKNHRFTWNPRFMWAWIQIAEARLEVWIEDTVQEVQTVAPRSKTSCRPVEPSFWVSDREQLASAGLTFQVKNRRKVQQCLPRPIPPPRPAPVPVPCPSLPVVINPPAPHLGD